MQRINLIENKSVGDKLSELVALVSGNFPVLMRWAIYFLLPFSVAYMLIYDYVFDVNETHTCFIMLLLLTLPFVLSITWINVAFKHYFYDKEEFRDMRLPVLMKETLQMSGKAYYTVFVYLVIVSIIGSGMLRLPATVATENTYGNMFVCMLVYSVIAGFSVVAMVAVSVVVFERQVGLVALVRALRLVQENFFTLMLFLPMFWVISFVIEQFVAIPMTLASGITALFLKPSELNLPQWAWDSMAFFGPLFVCFFSLAQIVILGIGMILQYGDAVESLDNVWFDEQFKHFDEL